jgi:putative transposase
MRKDTLHKLTTLLAKNHGNVVIEDLNVSGMLANHKLVK